MQIQREFVGGKNIPHRVSASKDRAVRDGANTSIQVSQVTCSQSAWIVRIVGEAGKSFPLGSKARIQIHME